MKIKRETAALEKELLELDGVQAYVNGRRRAITVRLKELEGLPQQTEHAPLSFFACCCYAIASVSAIVIIAIVNAS